MGSRHADANGFRGIARHLLKPLKAGGEAATPGHVDEQGHHELQGVSRRRFVRGAVVGAGAFVVIPIHFERAVKPSFPRRACLVLDTGREPTPWPHIYGGITATWYQIAGRPRAPSPLAGEGGACPELVEGMRVTLARPYVRGGFQTRPRLAVERRRHFVAPLSQLSRTGPGGANTTPSTVYQFILSAP